MKKKLLGILVCMLLIATAFSVNGCVELNDIKSNISIGKGIASSSTTADYKSFFNRHEEGESNILNKNGNWQWAKGAGGTDYDFGAATTTLSDDSTIVIGSFSGSATFGKGEPNETPLVSDGSTDIFLAKHNPDGTIAWAKRAGGTDYDFGAAIVTLSDESIIVTGSFSGSATFGKGEPNETPLVSDGSTDIFLAKHNTDGTIAWAKRAGGTDYDVGAATTTLSDDSTVVTGFFSGSATFGKGEPNETPLVSDGSTDIFLAKHNTDGTIAWAKRAGGTDYDVGAAIVTLSDESIIVTGFFSGSATFGKGEPNETPLVSDGSTDIFLAKHNPDGTIAWAKRAGGTDYDVGAAIVTLSDESIIVTGSFSGSATFGKGEPNETPLVSDGSTDIFLAKHNPDGTIAWAKRAGGTSEDAGQGIVTLSDESIIVTGFFSGSATFGKGESSETTLTSDGSTDIFLAKHNTDGTIAWAKRAGGTSEDAGQGIVTLSDDSTVVTGSFEGIADFGPYSLTSQGDSDVFVAKLGNQPPSTPTIDGPTEGTAGEQYTYSFSTSDPDGDDVYYYIKWGDGDIVDWFGPYESGDEIKLSHTWTDENTYTISAKAKDSWGAIGEWGTLEITMPVNQPIQYPLLGWFLELFPNAFPILRQLRGLYH